MGLLSPVKNKKHTKIKNHINLINNEKRKKQKDKNKQTAEIVKRRNY